MVRIDQLAVQLCLLSLQVVKLLVGKWQADVTATDNQRRQSPLHLAVHQGHAELIEWLLINVEPKAQRQMVTARDCDGETALHMALCREGQPVSSDGGITHEASPVICQLYEKAETEGVRQSHAIAIAAFLIVKGADIRAKNSKVTST